MIFFQVVRAVGQNAAVKLGLICRQLPQLRLNSQKLVDRPEGSQAGIGIQAAGDAGVDLFAVAGLLRGLGLRLGLLGSKRADSDDQRVYTARMLTWRQVFPKTTVSMLTMFSTKLTDCSCPSLLSELEWGEPHADETLCFLRSDPAPT